MRGTIRECFVCRGCQHGTCLAVWVMGRPLLCLLPPGGKRMGIRRRRWQGRRRAARALGGPKRVGRGAGGRPRALVAQHQLLRGVSHDPRSKRWGTGRVHPALHTLRDETPSARGNRAKDCVAFARAPRGPLRLPATARPRGPQGPPRRTAGLSGQPDAPRATRRRSDHRRPLLLQPGEARGRVALLRHQPGLVKSPPQLGRKGQPYGRLSSPPHARQSSPRMSPASQHAVSQPTTRGPASRRSPRRFFCLGRHCGRRPPR